MVCGGRRTQVEVGVRHPQRLKHILYLRLHLNQPEVKIKMESQVKTIRFVFAKR